MTVSFDSDGLCFSVSKLTHFLYCFPGLFSHLHGRPDIFVYALQNVSAALTCA